MGNVYGDYIVTDILLLNPPKLFLSCTTCGNQIEVSYNSLKCGIWKKDRCTKHILPTSKYNESYNGNKYGRLEVISVRSGNARKFECKCECENIIYARPIDLINGVVKSCGCIMREKTENSISKDRLYHIWNGMKSRCYNKNEPKYRNYGGRGIAVCPEWKDNYPAFKERAYSTGYDEKAPFGECTIDRIDVNGNYEPSNCRWITNKEQQSNKRPSSEWAKRTCKKRVFLILNGEKISKRELCSQYGISESMLNYRINKKKMSVYDALTVPKICEGRPRKSVIAE